MTDVYPFILAEYDAENPKLVTNCDHHFHLACILEWMERSESCPVCDQVSPKNSQFLIYLYIILDMPLWIWYF